MERNEIKFMTKLLVLVSEYDVRESLYWDEDLNFYIICNDIFWWATSDAEDITEETLPILEQALEDAGDTGYDGPYLYCARQRKMRPQGAAYKYIDESNYVYFDEFPERDDTEPGNTPKPEKL